MTDSNQYIPFVISRLFAGILGSVPAVLGATTITDLFFLHERGRSFLVLSLSFLLGTVAGPTFGGFIVEHVDWPVEFWWVVGLQGAASVLVFLFLEETGYNRDGGPIYPKRPKSFMANRIATFFFGTKVVPTMSYTEVVRRHPFRNLKYCTNVKLASLCDCSFCHWSIPSHSSYRYIPATILRLVCYDQYASDRLSPRASKGGWLRVHTAAKRRIHLFHLVRRYICPNIRTLSQRLASSLDL